MEELTKLKEKEIIITDDFNIKLKEQTLFLANGEEGLHLWEASICLARYCVLHKEMFEEKNVIELGTGVGLLGITLLKKTNLKRLTFSDYNDSVLKNLKENIDYNQGQKEKYEILKLNWKDYEKANEKYDIIVGTELIYQGGLIEELAKLIKKILNSDGKCFISMPKQRSMTNKFLEYATANGLKYSVQSFNDMECKDRLFKTVMKNEKESKKLFEDLEKMNFMLYTFSHNN